MAKLVASLSSISYVEIICYEAERTFGTRPCCKMKSCYTGTTLRFGAASTVLTIIFILASAKALKATEDACAVVLKTPDGFLNLRKAPTSQSEVITKLKRGDFLYVDTARCETRDDLSICDELQPPQWTHVTSVRRIDGKNPRTFTRGWVSDQYIQWFLCEED